MLHCNITRLSCIDSGAGGRIAGNPQDSRREPLGDRHPGLSRRKRAWHEDGRRCSPRRTSSRCTASRPTRPTRSAAGRISSSRSGPIEAYLSIAEILRVAERSGADAIHPGYGLLSESPEFAEACAAAGITFIGPSPDTMRRLGNKVAARDLASAAGVPVMPATDPLPDDPRSWKRLAEEIGYPLMLKASWGGGGRGMRVIRDEAALVRDVTEAKREAKAAFGKDEVYLEKLVERARHIEVQILGDTARQPRAPLRARLLDPAPPPEGRGARAGALPDRGAARGAVRLRAEDRRGRRLCLRRHGRVPAGRRRPANSTSSRSIRASRSSTPSPRR